MVSFCALRAVQRICVLCMNVFEPRVRQGTDATVRSDDCWFLVSLSCPREASLGREVNDGIEGNVREAFSLVERSNIPSSKLSVKKKANCTS